MTAPCAIPGESIHPVGGSLDPHRVKALFQSALDRECVADAALRHRLDPPKWLGLFRRVRAAVQHAHQKRIIHRDLKPTDIVVEDHDGTPVPKVIDFGLAKATSGLGFAEASVFTPSARSPAPPSTWPRSRRPSAPWTSPPGPTSTPSA